MGGDDMADKDKMIVSMFLAASLLLSAGCGSHGGGSSHVHVDKDGDGYCDECNASMNNYHGTGSHYYGLPHYGSTTQSGFDASHGDHMSTGTAAKAGIGSHAGGGAG
jgi:hypothetical protein